MDFWNEKKVLIDKLFKITSKHCSVCNSKFCKFEKLNHTKRIHIMR